MDDDGSRVHRFDDPWDCAAAAIVTSLGGAEVFLDQPASEQWRRGVTRPSDPVLALFDFERLGELLHRGRLLPPQIRMMRDGPVEPGLYMETEQSRKAAHYVRPDPAGVRHQLEQGATLAVARLDEFDAAVEETARALQWWLGAAVDVGLYAVATETRGFAPHVDDHEVIIVQLEGAKHWRVWEPTRRFPLERDVARPAAPTDLAWEGELRSGDTLCLPRGYWHTAWTTDPGISLHLTFGIHRRSGIDWLAALADKARSSETFRRDLPQYLPIADRASHHERLVDELIELAREHDWSTILDEHRTTTRARSDTALAARPDPDGERRLVQHTVPALVAGGGHRAGRLRIGQASPTRSPLPVDRGAIARRRTGGHRGPPPRHRPPRTALLVAAAGPLRRLAPGPSVSRTDGPVPPRSGPTSWSSSASIDADDQSPFEQRRRERFDVGSNHPGRHPERPDHVIDELVDRSRLDQEVPEQARRSIERRHATRVGIEEDDFLPHFRIDSLGGTNEEFAGTTAVHAGTSGTSMD